MKFLKVTNYDMELPLSANFKLGEFIVSQTALSNRLIMQYVHQKEIVDNLRFLCEALLQPLRYDLGREIIVTSGYRCSALNSLVGGAPNSLHIKGLAADIVCPGAMAELIESAKNLRYHELILHDGYIHVSYKQMWNENRFKDLRTS